MSNIQLRPTHDATLAAADVIARYLQPSPLKSEAAFSKLLNADVSVKYEFLNPVKSFKIRGALNLAHELARRGDVSRVITVSTGNHGAAMAFACGKYDIPLTVGVPVNCDQSKVELIRQFNGDLEFIGHDIDETKELLLSNRQDAGSTTVSNRQDAGSTTVGNRQDAGSTTVFIEDGSCPEIVAGTSTIGWEIVQQQPDIEVMIVPVGNGALIGGIGTALKAFNPAIRVIGVQAEQAPCMALSFHAGKPVNTESCETFASGMAVRVSIPEAVNLMLEAVDEMHLVTETELKAAMGLFYRHTGHLPEGAGVAPLAAALKIRATLENRKVCLLASGANVDLALQQEIEDLFMNKSNNPI